MTSPSELNATAEPQPTEPAVEFVDQSRRFATVDLDFPLILDGERYERIIVRRLTVAEVATFVDTLKSKSDSDAVVRWPMTFNPNGAPTPEAVLAGLDDDDALKLEEVIQSFLPRRFRTDPE